MLEYGDTLSLAVFVQERSRPDKGDRPRNDRFENDHSHLAEGSPCLVRQI